MPLTRRELLNGIAALAGLTALEKVAQAKPEVCDLPKKGTLLAEACEAKFDPENNARLKAGLRSSPEFAELTRQASPHIEGKDGNISVLYPAGGSHIAPLEIGRMLLARRDVQTVEMVYTEIDETALENLKNNLALLAKVNHDFTPDMAHIETHSGNGGGTEFIIPIWYKKKTIRLRFLLNCSGEAYYSDNEFKKAGIFVEHDSGGYMLSQILSMMRSYIDSSRITGQQPVLFMEDTTRMRDGLAEKKGFHRRFDLELLGTLQRGKHPYGHSEAQPVQRALQPRGETAEYEIGKNEHKNGVIFTTDQGMANADPNMIAFLMEADIVAINESDEVSAGAISEYKRIASLDKPKRPKLHSTDFYRDLIAKGPETLHFLEQARPETSGPFGLRLLADLIKLMRFFDKTAYQQRKTQSIREFGNVVLGLIATIERHLPKTDAALVQPHIQSIKECLQARIEYFTAYAKMEDLIGRMDEFNGPEGYEKRKELFYQAEEINKQWKKHADEPFKKKLAGAVIGINRLADERFEALTAGK